MSVSVSTDIIIYLCCNDIIRSLRIILLWATKKIFCKGLEGGTEFFRVKTALLSRKTSKTGHRDKLLVFYAPWCSSVFVLYNRSS